MSEKFEVGYTRVPAVGAFDVYHKYILYTNNAGEQFYARGGPVFINDGTPNVSDLKLRTESGEYREGTPDWDKSVNNPSLEPHTRETVGTGDDLSTKWQKIKDTIADIGSRNIPYDYEDTNSNATVDEALRSADVPAPLRDGPSDHWAPGSDYDLPGGDTTDSGKTFDENAREFLRKKFRDINDKYNDIKDTAKKWWDDATNWRPRIDPLTLDLDRDGIETLGVNADNHVLFDHDGDGAKHGTGWVSSDDAMLVLDRNNNGTIDNGHELFGDNTQLANGRFAADGFAALAKLDINGGRAANDATYFLAA